MSSYDSGDLAWSMSSSMAIMLMAPGVGLFHSGMVNRKNLLSIISYSFLIFSTSTIAWGLVGFSLAFGSETLARGFIGDCTYCGLRYISDTRTNPFSITISFPSFFFVEMMYAGVAAVITILPFVGRLRTIYLILISIAHQLIIYAPVTYWLRSSSGWMNKLGVIDFSGGSMVHLTSGAATLAVLYMIGEGSNQIQRLNSISTLCTLMGTALIWFSSFGFNGVAAFTSGLPSSVALINTQLGAAGGAFGWAFTQYIITDRAKVMGWCSGAVIGLISITPCSGYVSLWAAVVIGAFASIFAYIFCHFKSHNNEVPDTPSVFNCHGIGAFWGILCAGAFANPESGSSHQGLFYGGGSGARLFGVNLLCAIVVTVYSFVIMLFIHFLTLRLVEPALPEDEQEEGLDAYSHVQESDPLDEEDIVNIIRTLHDYNELNKLMESNYDLPPTQKSIELSRPRLDSQKYDRAKLRKEVGERRKSQANPIASRKEMMEKIHKKDADDEQDMILRYEKNLSLKKEASQKQIL